MPQTCEACPLPQTCEACPRRSAGTRQRRRVRPRAGALGFGCEVQIVAARVHAGGHRASQPQEGPGGGRTSTSGDCIPLGVVLCVSYREETGVVLYSCLQLCSPHRYNI